MERKFFIQFFVSFFLPFPFSVGMGGSSSMESLIIFGPSLVTLPGILSMSKSVSFFTISRKPGIRRMLEMPFSLMSGMAAKISLRIL